jgi:TetR/AcrR family transcriptional regulator, cholesterol catabolism regulator
VTEPVTILSSPGAPTRECGGRPRTLVPDSTTPKAPTKERASGARESARADRRRAEIVQAAIRLFSEKGYVTTSTQDIGREVGLLAGSLYYHIRSKEELLYDILLELHIAALDELAIIDAAGGDPIERLRRLVRNHVVNHDVPRLRLFETEFHHLNEERHKKIMSMRRIYTTYAVDRIHEAQEQGLCTRDVDPRAMGLSLLGALNAVPKWFNPRGGVGIEAVADSFDRMVLGGLGVEPGRAPVSLPQSLKKKQRVP